MSPNLLSAPPLAPDPSLATAAKKFESNLLKIKKNLHITVNGSTNGTGNHFKSLKVKTYQMLRLNKTFFIIIKLLTNFVGVPYL